MKTEFIVPCQCGMLIDVIRVSSWDDGGSVSVEFLVEPRSLWHRLRNFWRSLFGYGLIHETVLSPESATELGEWLVNRGGSP